MRARSKSSRASARPLENLLFLKTTSASRVAASSASKPCRAVRSKFSSVLIRSRLVAIPSMRALVAPCCVSKPSSVTCANFSSFFTLASSVLLFSRYVFVASSSFFEALDSIFDSSSLVVSWLISRSALALVSAFAVVSCRLTSTSVKVLWGGGRSEAWVKVVVAGPKSKVLGSITGGSGRDTGGGWPTAVVIGPKAKACGGADAEPEIGRSFPCDADGSTMVVGMGGGMRGVDAGTWQAGGTKTRGCDADGVKPVRVSSLSAFLSSPSFGDCNEDGVMPVGVSAPFPFSEIGRLSPRGADWSMIVVEVGGGCDEDVMISADASAPFAFSEIGRSFPRDAGALTMVVEVGDGTRGFDAGRWPAGGTRAGGCDGDSVMPVCASAPFVFSEIG